MKLLNPKQTPYALGVIAFLLLLFYTLRIGYVALELFADGGQTSASIIDTGVTHSGGEHARERNYFVDYSYLVDGQEYEGSAGVGSTDGGYGRGGTITITYLRSDPSVSSYSPTGMFLEGLSGIILCIIAIPILVWQFFRNGNATAGAPQIGDDDLSFLHD